MTDSMDVMSIALFVADSPSTLACRALRARKPPCRQRNTSPLRVSARLDATYTNPSDHLTESYFRIIVGDASPHRALRDPTLRFPHPEEKGALRRGSLRRAELNDP